MKNNKPNFFIVGAPKCGTTALARYLSDHDDIFITDPKEPHFFATDIENYRTINTYEAYEELYSDVNKEKFIGEASVFYLYSKEALKNIKKFNPESKIIVMIRNPVEMVPSLHSQVIYSGDEHILDFEEAWDSNADRKKDQKISKNTRDAQILFYDEIAKYDKQLLRLREHFDDSKIKIILFEDFKNDCQKVYEDVLAFLTAQQDGRTDFPKVNENKKLRSVGLNTAIKRIPKPVLSIYSFLKAILGIKEGFSITKKLNRFNTVIERRDELSIRVKSEIIQTYQEDILNLEKTVNRNLAGWLK